MKHDINYFLKSSDPNEPFLCNLSDGKPQLSIVGIIDLRNYKHAV